MRRFTFIATVLVLVFATTAMAYHVATIASQTKKTVDPKLLASLADKLRSEDFRERPTALSELSKLLDAHKGAETEFAPVVEPLFRHAGWGGISRGDSRLAEDLIVRIGATALPLLKERLKSDDSHHRRVAIELLVRIGPRDTSLAALLRPMLADHDYHARRSAIIGLAAIGPPAKESIADLERLAENDPILLHHVSARSALIAVAGVSKERIQDLAAFLEMKIELREGKDQAQPPEEGARSAASALGSLGPKARSAEPQLLAALKQPKLTSTAAHALGQIGANSPEVIAALIDVLKNAPQREARRSAAGALGAIGPPAKEAAPALRAALKGDEKGGWWVAADALGKIGGAEVVPILIEALENPDGDIRLSSLRSLGNLGSLAKSAIPALEKARKDEAREYHRVAAAEAIRKIEDATKKQ